MTPSWPENTKTPPQSGGNSYFLIEKSPLTAFLYNTIIPTHFVRNRSRIKRIFTSGHFELYLFKVLGVISASKHPD
jgi:hypothetical protein